MYSLFENKDKRIGVSWKWATKKIDCTIKGITKENGCKGVCCTGNFYPAKANGGKCIYLGSKGCELKPSEKPIKCLLYPFVVKNNNLVLYGRALMQSCKLCYFPKDEKVPSIFVNLKDNLIELFGEEQYNRVYNDVIVKNKNSFFILPDYWEREVDKENNLEKLNINPKKRKK